MKLRVTRPLWLAAGIVSLAVLAFFLGYLRSRPVAYSNIHPQDYVGPAVCGGCHERNYKLWREHPHRTMNLTATEESVRGDFSGVEIAYGRGHAKFHRDGPDFIMSIFENGRLARRHKITRTVGSVYMQYYVGRQVFGPEPASHLSYVLESKLPFAYLFKLKRWLPEVYLDSTSQAEHLYLNGTLPDYIYEPLGHNWNASCMTCHNTYPYLARLWEQPPPHHQSGLWRGGFPKSDVNLEGSRLHQGRLTLGPNLKGLHADELITVGISCESCHFGGREHAMNGEGIRFVPTAPGLTLRRAGTGKAVISDRTDPYVVNGICSQCHNSQLISYPSGASAINSNESTDMARGGCSSRIKCTNCHNPHKRGPGSGAPDQPEHVEACLGCHHEYRDASRAADHSRHSAKSGVNCLDCHMPRIVAGLDAVTRTHHISSPMNEEMLASGNLNACSLCHLDRPIQWTLDELEKGWKRRIELDRMALGLYGANRDTPVGHAWLQSPDKFVRLAATEGYARSPVIEDPIPFLLHSLNEPNAFNRMVALVSLQRLLGRELTEGEYQLTNPADPRSQQLSRLRSSGALSREYRESRQRGAAEAAAGSSK